LNVCAEVHIDSINKNVNLYFAAGVIDEDYRGNVGVILFNHADEDFSIVKGDRIAQLICQKILYPEVVEVEVSLIFLSNRFI